jgi:hypothetical protein
MKWFSALFLALLIGCTVIPRNVRSPVASFSGTNQNSGFIGFASDGQGIINAQKRDEYNALARQYGTHWLVPVKPDDGLRATTTNTWIIDQEHLVKFQHMQWLRNQDKAK